MKTIHAVTEIAAPPETVWSELSAVASFADWNPFITSFEGELVVGRRAQVRIVPAGGKAMTFKPTITVVEEGKRLEWLGRLLVPGVFDGRHSFLLEDLGDGRTRLTQAEVFTGVLVPLAGGTVEKTQAGFEAMNEALRLRAERAATEIER
ncbi:SRPBCC family protein [Cellulomonas sp. McL0617]|uniref:SRPBCC family protein n=1 Tax=Cellulomonas sp. McL0617 TaxID=3415675 RepID=UPI003CEC1EA0